jgi:hypothetical protein
MTAPDAQHAGVPLRQISLNTFYIADSDPTWIALPLSEDAQKARVDAVMAKLPETVSENLRRSWAREIVNALGIGGPA